MTWKQNIIILLKWRTELKKEELKAKLREAQESDPARFEKLKLEEAELKKQEEDFKKKEEELKKKEKVI